MSNHKYASPRYLSLSHTHSHSHWCEAHTTIPNFGNTQIYLHIKTGFFVYSYFVRSPLIYTSCNPNVIMFRVSPFPDYRADPARITNENGVWKWRIKKKKKGTKNEQCYTSRIGCHFIATVLPDPNYIISIYPNFWARKKKGSLLYEPGRTWSGCCLIICYYRFQPPTFSLALTLTVI